MTPLMSACLCGVTHEDDLRAAKVVQRLLDAGAEVGAKKQSGPFRATWCMAMQLECEGRCSTAQCRSNSKSRVRDSSHCCRCGCCTARRPRARCSRHCCIVDPRWWDKYIGRAACKVFSKHSTARLLIARQVW